MSRPPGSHNSFAAALKRAMSDRGVTQKDVALGIDASTTSVCDWRHGRSIPQLTMAARLGEFLVAASLVEMVVAHLTGRCKNCDAPIVGMGSKPRQFCSRACRMASASRRRRGSTRDVGTTARHRLTLYQDAVAAFCAGCEPEGLCRTPECPLRSCSPLPLVRVNAA